MGIASNVLAFGFIVCFVQCQASEPAVGVFFLLISAPSPTELILKWGPPEGISDLKRYILTSHDAMLAGSHDLVTLKPDTLQYTMRNLMANCNYTIQLWWEGELNNGTVLERTVRPKTLYEKSLQKRRQPPGTLIFTACIASSSLLYVIVVVVLLVYYCRRRHELLFSSDTVDISVLSIDKPFHKDMSERYSRTELLQHPNRTSTLTGIRLDRIRTDLFSDDVNAYASPIPPSKTSENESKGTSKIGEYENHKSSHGYQQIGEAGYLNMAPLDPDSHSPPPVPEGPYAEVTDRAKAEVLHPYETPVQSRANVNENGKSSLLEDGYISMEKGVCQPKEVSLHRSQSTHGPLSSRTRPVRRNESMSKVRERVRGTSHDSLSTDDRNADATGTMDIQEFSTSCPVVAPFNLLSEASEEGFEITLTLRSKSKHQQ